jgi:hypothetical protein
MQQAGCLSVEQDCHCHRKRPLSDRLPCTEFSKPLAFYATVRGHCWGDALTGLLTMPCLYCCCWYIQAVHPAVLHARPGVHWAPADQGHGHDCGVNCCLTHPA